MAAVRRYKVNNSEVPRLERYLTFHLREILEELERNDSGDSDRESTGSAKRGSLATVLEEFLQRSRDDITSALVRMKEGTYGNCVRCGKEIDQRRLEKVPWSKFCRVCEQGSEEMHHARYD